MFGVFAALWYTVHMINIWHSQRWDARPRHTPPAVNSQRRAGRDWAGRDWADGGSGGLGSLCAMGISEPHIPPRVASAPGFRGSWRLAAQTNILPTEITAMTTSTYGAAMIFANTRESPATGGARRLVEVCAVDIDGDCKSLSESNFGRCSGLASEPEGDVASHQGGDSAVVATQFPRVTAPDVPDRTLRDVFGRIGTLVQEGLTRDRLPKPRRFSTLMVFRMKMSFLRGFGGSEGRNVPNLCP